MDQCLLNDNGIPFENLKCETVEIATNSVGSLSEGSVGETDKNNGNCVPECPIIVVQEDNKTERTERNHSNDDESGHNFSLTSQVKKLVSTTKSTETLTDDLTGDDNCLIYINSIDNGNFPERIDDKQAIEIGEDDQRPKTLLGDIRNSNPETNCKNFNSVVKIKPTDYAPGLDIDLYSNKFKDVEESSDYLDPNLEFDEDSLNPNSLPFESLNSSLQYSVLIDSDEDDINNDNELDDSNSLTDSELNPENKNRQLFHSGDIHEATDFLSTEAENQLECCDKWSLGSCSIGGFECRTLEKRRRSIHAKEDEKIFAVGECKFETTPIILEQENSVSSVDDSNEVANVNSSRYKNVTLIKKEIGETDLNTCVAAADIAGIILMNQKVAEFCPANKSSIINEQCNNSAGASQQSDNEVVSVVSDRSNKANEMDVQNTVTTGDSRPQAFDAEMSTSSLEQKDAIVDPSVSADIPNTAVEPDVVHTLVDIESTHFLTNKEDSSGVTRVNQDKSMLPSTAAEANSNSEAIDTCLASNVRDTVAPQTSTQLMPAESLYRRNCSLQTCTVILPPCIDEEPDVLEPGENIFDVVMHDGRLLAASSLYKLYYYQHIRWVFTHFSIFKPTLHFGVFIIHFLLIYPYSSF